MIMINDKDNINFIIGIIIAYLLFAQKLNSVRGNTKVKKSTEQDSHDNINRYIM